MNLYNPVYLYQYKCTFWSVANTNANLSLLIRGGQGSRDLPSQPLTLLPLFRLYLSSLLSERRKILPFFLPLYLRSQSASFYPPPNFLLPLSSLASILTPLTFSLRPLPFLPTFLPQSPIHVSPIIDFEQWASLSIWVFLLLIVRFGVLVKK